MSPLSNRPKFFIDENMPADYAAILRKPFRSALFRSYVDERLSRTEDIEIFGELQLRGFTGIVTQDRHQLFYQLERDGLRSAGLHWFGLVGIEGKGIEFHSQVLAVLTSVLPALIRATPPVPHAFFITPDHRQIVKNIESEPL